MAWAVKSPGVGVGWMCGYGGERSIGKPVVSIPQEAAEELLLDSIRLGSCLVSTQRWTYPGLPGPLVLWRYIPAFCTGPGSNTQNPTATVSCLKPPALPGQDHTQLPSPGESAGASDAHDPAACGAED